MYSSNPTNLQDNSVSSVSLSCPQPGLNPKPAPAFPDQAEQQREAWRFLNTVFNLPNHKKLGYLQLDQPDRPGNQKMTTGLSNGFDSVLAKIDLNQTTYILSNELRRMPHRAEGDNHAGWWGYPIDLDYKTNPRLAHLTPEEVWEAVKIKLESIGITPGIGVSTTHKGLHVWILFQDFVTTKAWIRVKLIVHALIEGLADLGADKKVSHKSQWIRMPGSVHQATGHIVEIIEAPGHRHTLEELEAALGLESQDDIKARKKASRAKRRATRKAALKRGRKAQARGMLRDLIRLGLMAGEIPEGNRIEFLYQLANTYAVFAKKPERIERLIPVWRARFTPSLSEHEALKDLTTITARAKAGGYYRLSSQRFADLAIALGQDHEPRLFHTPLDDDERHARDNMRKMERRRRNGVKPAEQYHREITRGAQSRCNEAHRLKARGFSNNAIAGKLGVTVKSVRNYLRDAPKKISPVWKGGNHTSLPPWGVDPSLAPLRSSNLKSYENKEFNKVPVAPEKLKHTTKSKPQSKIKPQWGIVSPGHYGYIRASVDYESSVPVP